MKNRQKVGERNKLPVTERSPGGRATGVFALANLICSVFGHRVSRRRIRKDGDTYVGRCRVCRKRLQKGDDGWEERERVREYDPA